ncbi:MAG: glycosyltransferase family 25 protein, partial [Bacteroidetes bacterium]|nr:glycosyltransferase family 25 protein [Bacteroidota bacterium]
MKVYVINMERSKGRREVIEAQLKKLKLDYEIVSAVDGRQMSDEELELVALRKNDFMKSQAGCMLSHLKVYKRMQEEQDEFALVLEDDVIATEKGMTKVL